MALPSKTGGDQEGINSEREREDPSTIFRCLAESSGDMAKVLQCRECFKGVDPSSDNWLDKAKACVELHWPQAAQACSAEIAAMDARIEKTLLSSLECIDQRYETLMEERCLNNTVATDIQGRLTEGAICVMKLYEGG